MKNTITCIALIGSIGLAASAANAAPLATQTLRDVAQQSPIIENARLYCHMNGVFLHWGSVRPGSMEIRISSTAPLSSAALRFL